MTPVNCSFSLVWELVIVSWALRGHFSSLGAINNHYNTSTHTTHTHEPKPLTAWYKAVPNSFGGFHHCVREIGSVIDPFRALLHLLAVFLYMCLRSRYVLYIHTSLSIQALWLDPKKCCILPLFHFGLKCAYLPFSRPISLIPLCFFFFFCRIIWDN